MLLTLASVSEALVSPARSRPVDSFEAFWSRRPLLRTVFWEKIRVRRWVILGLFGASLPVALPFGAADPLLLTGAGSCITVPFGGEIFEAAEIEPAGDAEPCCIDVDMCVRRR